MRRTCIYSSGGIDNASGYGSNIIMQRLRILLLVSNIELRILFYNKVQLRHLLGNTLQSSCTEDC
jgi:hypothetical protein